MNKRTIQLENGGWRLPVEHCCVNRCAVDHAFSIEFHEESEISVVRIESEFDIIDQGHAHHLIPSEPGELGPAVALLGQVVSSAMVFPDGTLSVIFENGRVMKVAPDSDYEAWEFVGTGGMRVVCSPGGEIAVWQPV